MKSFFWKFAICIVPVALASWVTYYAWTNNKFKWGVDLSGGTILVYEMDIRKAGDEQGGKDAKGEQDTASYFKQKAGELAEALKRRIDPTATYNIVVRPAGTEGRVEIILPTGGREQTLQAEEDWSKLLTGLEGRYGIKDLDVPRGSVGELVDVIERDEIRKTWDGSLFNAKQNPDAWQKLLKLLATPKDNENPDGFDRALVLTDIVLPSPQGVASFVGAAAAAAATPVDTALPAAAAYRANEKASGEPWIEKLKALPAGDLDALMTNLATAIPDKTRQELDTWLKDQAWKELIDQVTRWDYIREQYRKALPKDLGEDEQSKKLEEELATLRKKLQEVPADSFQELIGRIQTRGDVVSQAALDTVRPLLGGIPDLSGLLDREKIAAFVREHYGPSPEDIRESIKQIAEKEHLTYVGITDTDTGLSRDLTLEEVQRIKDLVAKVGALEFRILANSKDDSVAIGDAQKYLNRATGNPPDPKVAEELERAAVEGEPPPGPREEQDPTKLKKYPILLKGDTKDEPTVVTYSWVELGKQVRNSLGLNNDARNDANAVKKKTWHYMNENSGRAVQIPDFSKSSSDAKLWGGALFYRREVKDRNLPEKVRREKKYEYFVLTRNPEILDGKQTPQINGSYLRRAFTDVQSGSPQVNFMFDARGAELFGRLTGKNVPSGGGVGDQGKFKRHLSIVLDGQVMSAPTINSKITSSGTISGSFTRAEVDALVNILRSGALPATLNPQPVSESTIGALLGQDTIQAGWQAIIGAFLAVVVFMIIYYRFSGLVASLALFANLILTVGFMVAVQATFTLPGLAGIVLMLGMAVDANVLIYERLREERDRGASLALALRNGYERAFPTIIDTHLTSIFTAVVLYAVGNDQLKGFGISLTVGLIISLFTSLYMTRTIFDFWLSRGWLRDLKFFRILSNPNINFMGIRNVVFGASVSFTVLGLAVFMGRMPADLNIDFKGGTAFSGQLQKGEAVDIEGLRALFENKAVPQAGGAKRYDLLLKVESVAETEGSKGREYTITYVNPDGKTKEVRTLNLAKAPLPLENSTQEEREKDVAARAQGLPDWSVEQIFPGFKEAQEKDPSTSRFFTVRTSEKERELVQYTIDRLLRRPAGGEGDAQQWVSLLKNIQMDYDPAGLRNSDGKFVLLTFSGPDQGGDGDADGAQEPPYASPLRVKSLLHRELRKKFEIDPTTGKLKVEFDVIGEGKSKGGRFGQMRVRFDPPLKAGQVEGVLAALQQTQQAFEGMPQPERLENFDSELAADTRLRALGAIFASWLAIVLYLWFRFGSWTFGAAALCCLIHDVCFVLGLIALSAYVAPTPIGQALLVEDFKIDLTAVAALLTLVGYSVADTIVVFDRIREVRGKDPHLTPKIINDSINQTLSRTLLTSGTTFLVVIVLYIFGGPGVHGFAFIMSAGVLIGTFSSIYIASPLLLIFGEGQQADTRARQRQQAAAGGAPATT